MIFIKIKKWQMLIKFRFSKILILNLIKLMLDLIN